MVLADMNRETLASAEAQVRGAGGTCLAVVGDVSGGGDLNKGIELSGRMYPVGRIAELVEIARPVAFMAGGDSSFMTGSTLTLDGGLLSQYPAAIAYPEPQPHVR